MSAYITASGAALPRRCVSNQQLAYQLGVTPEWIESNSGIKERRWVDPDQSASDLAASAVSQTIAHSNLRPEQVDYLIGSTISPDYQVPGIAPLVQSKAPGLRDVPAVDLRVGCTAILYSLQIASALISAGTAQSVVCFGAEAQSKALVLDRDNAEISMLFGDGAGALMMTAQPAPARTSGRPNIRIDDVMIRTDGNFATDLCVRAPGTANGPRWMDRGQFESGLFQPSMNGKSVILHAVRKLAMSAQEVTDRNSVRMDQIGLVIPHQANGVLLNLLAKRLEIPAERIVMNLDRYGNTSSASAFIALWQAAIDGRFEPGMRILIMAFGAGFSWGAALGTVVA
jgi:3-oxoacyl-[acyl-carrier-protein] synthase-3